MSITGTFSISGASSESPIRVRIGVLNGSNIKVVWQSGGEEESYSGPSIYHDYTEDGVYGFEIKSVTSIGDEAFSGCYSLTSVTIPGSVKSIGSGVFAYCSALTSITVDSNNPKYTSDNGNLYNQNKTTLIQYATGKQDTQFTIPNSVTSIGEWAFSGCSLLKEITIPDSVTSIGEAFSGCVSLESITIPDSVTSIGYRAFSDCESLTNIGIPDSVTSIGDDAFSYCYNLTNIVIPSSVTSIGKYAFGYCYNLTSVTIGSGVVSIGDSAFYNCTALKTITIPDNVTSIGISVFGYCYGLKNITIGNGITSISESVFQNCTSLKNITIPNSVTSISNEAFRYCTALNNIVIPNSVTSIGDYAFNGDSSLTSITVGSGVASIGTEAFLNCNKLIEVIILNNEHITITPGSDSNGGIGKYALSVKISGTSDIVNVNDYLFYTANNINYLIGYIGSNTILNLPNDYNGEGYQIYKYAFQNNNNMTGVIIPSNVNSIGEEAFGWCSALVDVYLLKIATTTTDVPTITNNTFSTISSNAKFYVYQSSLEYYKTKENWTTYASKIVDGSLRLDFAQNANANKNWVRNNTVNRVSTTNKIYGTDSSGSQTTYDKSSFESADSTILKQTNVINNTTSTSTIYPLSANMGKSLQDQVDNLKAIGRYLSDWDCTTGLATTSPTTLPYKLQSGDYFVVSKVAGYTHAISMSGTDYSGNSYTVQFSIVNKVATQYDSISSIIQGLYNAGHIDHSGTCSATGTITDHETLVERDVEYIAESGLNSILLQDSITSAIGTITTAQTATITDTVTGSAINYKPTLFTIAGREGYYYTGSASSVVETDTVNKNDYYRFDGETWQLEINTQRVVTFANIAGEPTDNSNLASVLNNKVNKTTTIAEITLEDNITKAELKEALEIDNVDNTSDANKPISSLTQSALNLKQNATDNSLTTTLKTVVGAINENKTNIDLKVNLSNLELKKSFFDILY